MYMVLSIMMMNMQCDDDELLHSRRNGVMFAVNRDYKYYTIYICTCLQVLEELQRERRYVRA